jgi:hypothetical protein
MAKARSSRRESLSATRVRDFRQALTDALNEKDDEDRKWSAAKWGCYAFYDYDGEPIYVGQTNERLSFRIRRHLTNQRTDAVAMRILDVFEVAELKVWPLWEYQAVNSKSSNYQQAKQHLDALEFAVYGKALASSSFGAILNEIIPPKREEVALPPSRRFQLINDATRLERGHPDVRIARRSETLARLAAVAHERGVVTPGLRRVLVVQAIRLTHLAAVRLAMIEGREAPAPSTLNVEELVGPVWLTSAEPAEDD